MAMMIKPPASSCLGIDPFTSLMNEGCVGLCLYINQPDWVVMDEPVLGNERHFFRILE